MNKGIFSIPVYSQKTPMNVVLTEIKDQVVNSEKWGLQEAFFGEHITDKHEKISSSLLMVSALSCLTEKIKLGTLTTNLNFYKPAVIAAMIAMADNLSKGTLLLGIGSGANMSDIEAINSEDINNHAITIETIEIIKELLNSKDLVNIQSENFKVATKKFGNKDLGLGYFNQLYEERNNLEVLMPVLNANSYNVKLCAKNNWSIVISNFCSEDVIENHISSYLENSNLNEKEALKKIRLSKLIFAHQNKFKAKDLIFSDSSPFMQVVDVIFTKLKKYNKHGCFGKNKENTLDAAKNIILYGDPVEISEKLIKKYKGLSSILYVTVPMTGNENFDSSLEIFSKNVSI